MGCGSGAGVEDFGCLRQPEPRLACSGLGPRCVCARERGAESPGLLRVCCASARPGVGARARAKHTAQAAAVGLSEPLGLGWLRPDLRAAVAKARLRQAGKAEPGACGGGGGEQSMEQRAGRAGRSAERPINTAGKGRGSAGKGSAGAGLWAVLHSLC